MRTLHAAHWDKPVGKDAAFEKRVELVSDLDAGQAGRLAKIAGADLASGDNEEVIAHPQVNAVIVPASEHEHLKLVMRALELGKPVLVEKPIALTLADADRIIAKSEETGTPIRVGYA